MRIYLLAAASIFLVSPATAWASDLSEAEPYTQVLPQHADRDFRAFYEQRRFAPVWFVDGSLSSAGNALLDHLAVAQLDGLNSADYGIDQLRAVALNPGSDDVRSAENAFMEAFVRYARDMRRPVADMVYADAGLARQPTTAELLADAAKAPSFDSYVGQMEWMSPYYTQLRAALARIAPSADAPARIPDGLTLREGDSGESVRLLRRRLGLPDGDLFDADLGEAVRRFQEASGLTADRAAGPRTIAALNGPSGGDTGRLTANLERARALPGPWTRHVVVNSASGRLTMFGNGREEGGMKVIVGTIQTPTPIMAGVIHFATLNPYWNVPVDLARRSIAPAVLRGRSLSAMRYEALSDWTENATLVDSSEIDWRAVVDGQKDVRIRELPGRNNAMGNVKYIFPNDLGIFLHDTPNRHLFNRESRQFSNGCVRLEDAAGFGNWLFGQPLQASSTQPEQHIAVPDPVPVYLTYLTAVPSGDTIAYTRDVYGLDRAPSAQRLASN